MDGHELAHEIGRMCAGHAATGARLPALPSNLRGDSLVKKAH